MAKEFQIPGLKDAINEVERLQKAVKDAAADVLNLAVSGEKAMQPFKNNKDLIGFNDALKKSNETQKETAAGADILKKYQDRLAFSQSELGVKVAAANLQIQKQNAENKRTAAQMDESRTALEKYNAKVLEATTKAKNLGASLELMKMEGNASAKEIKQLEKEFTESAKSAKALNDRYREISKSAGDNRALVGSYSDELKGHFKTLETSLKNLGDNLKSNILKGDFKGALNEARTVVTGFGSEVKGISDVVKNYGSSLLSFASSNASAAASVDLGTASVIAETAVLDTNIASTEMASASKIGFVQSESAATVATDANTVSQEAAIATSESLAVSNSTLSASEIESAAAIEVNSAAGVEAAVVQADLSAVQIEGAIANEAIAASAISAAASNEALAVTEAEAAAAAQALAITTGSAAVGSVGLAGAETVAAVASEGLAVGATSAAVSVGILDAVLGILLAPITLIILALGLLFYIFKDFAPIVNPIKDAFAALGAVFSSIGQDIFDLVTGARSLADIFDTFGSKAADAAKEAYDLGQATRDLNKAMEIQEVTSAKVSTEIQLMLLRGRDLSKGFEERNKYLEKAIALEKEKSTAELKNNAEAIRIQAIRLFEGKELTEEVKKAIAEQDFAKIRSLKVKMNLDKDELESYKKLLIDKENLEKAQISIEEKAQNRINKNIQRKEEAEKKAAEDAKKAAEKAERDAEKAEKDRLAAAKKTAEEAIKVMKITLDNLISNYDQAEKLDEENITHAQAISAMKVQIANAERDKNLIGVKKGSIDEKSIIDASAQEIIKINQEKAKAISKISKDRAAFELELYDLNNQTILDGSKNLTDLLVDEEKRRLQETLAVHKERMRAELKIDADTTDEKLKLYAKTNAQLSANEIKYLKLILKEEDSTNKQIKKNDADLLKAKLSDIETEEKNELRKFRLLNKSEIENQRFEFKLIDDKLKKERKAFEEDSKRSNATVKEKEDNAKAIKEIDTKLAENQLTLDNLVLQGKKESLQTGLQALIDISGEESEIGKTAAIAQATINTYEGASKEFAKGGVLGFVTGGLVIAAGLATVAKIAGVKLFAEGTTDAPYTGKAIVDEEGAEIHTDQFGNIKSMGSDKGARFTNIVKHDKIVPADITAIIKRNMVSQYRVGDRLPDAIDYDKMGDQFGKHAGKIVSAIKSRRESNISVEVHKDVMAEVTFKKKKV